MREASPFERAPFLEVSMKIDSVPSPSFILSSVTEHTKYIFSFVKQEYLKGLRIEG
jgi:hypothetical protein